MSDTTVQTISDLTHARAILQHVLGADDRNVIYLLRPLAALLTQSGKHVEAEPVLREIVRFSAKYSASPSLPRLVDANTALADNLRVQGNFAEALQTYGEIIRLLSRNETGSSNEVVREKVFEIVASMVACMNSEGAIKNCRMILATMDEDEHSEQIQPVSAVVRLVWLSRLSRLLGSINQYAEAAEVAEKAVVILKQNNGEVACIPSLDSLAQLYKQAGNDAEFQRVRKERRELALKYDF